MAEFVNEHADDISLAIAGIAVVVTILMTPRRGK